MYKELWQSMMMWIAQEQERQERLAAVRQELARLGEREQPQPSMLSVRLY